ncbi:MAG: hypothetical protein LBM27_00605 [Lactobacillaceae bacterium]|jgi:hypothetical protein|nr:hypothetical protein [Lactobacillaceae bacterium]
MSVSTTNSSKIIKDIELIIANNNPSDSAYINVLKDFLPRLSQEVEVGKHKSILKIENAMYSALKKKMKFPPRMVYYESSQDFWSMIQTLQYELFGYSLS